VNHPEAVLSSPCCAGETDPPSSAARYPAEVGRSVGRPPRGPGLSGRRYGASLDGSNRGRPPSPARTGTAAGTRSPLWFRPAAAVPRRALPFGAAREGPAEYRSKTASRSRTGTIPQPPPPPANTQDPTRPTVVLAKEPKIGGSCAARIPLYLPIPGRYRRNPEEVEAGPSDETSTRRLPLRLGGPRTTATSRRGTRRRSPVGWRPRSARLRCNLPAWAGVVLAGLVHAYPRSDFRSLLGLHASLGKKPTPYDEITPRW
jgi:hypothetical protein